MPYLAFTKASKKDAFKVTASVKDLEKLLHRRLTFDDLVQVQIRLPSRPRLKIFVELEPNRLGEDGYPTTVATNNWGRALPEPAVGCEELLEVVAAEILHRSSQVHD